MIKATLLTLKWFEQPGEYITVPRSTMEELLRLAQNNPSEEEIQEWIDKYTLVEVK